nr:oligopeptide transporter [Tanacetum cinerariifolium]
MDLEKMVSYLKRKIRRRFTHLYYVMPPTSTIHGKKSIKSDYDTDVMYDIAKVTGKIQIYVSHHPIDLSTELISNDGSLEEAYAEMMNHVITNYTSDNEDERKETILSRLRGEQQAEATLADKLLFELNRVVEKMQTCEIHITMLHAMPLVDHLYGDMCIVGNHIVHTYLETVVARMVEMHMGSDGKFVTRIGFVCTFVMGMGYDMMVVMVDDRVLDGCIKVVAHMLEIVYLCLPGGQGQTVFGIGHVCVPLDAICCNIYFLAPYLEIVYDLYFWDDLVVGCPFEVEKQDVYG